MTDPDARPAPPAPGSPAPSAPGPGSPAPPGSLAPNGSPAHGRRPRLSDVAARAGVSAGLVSLVLRNQPGPSEQTRTRVLDAARELGYRADRTASLLARRRSQHLGVLMDVRNTFHAELVADIDAAATRQGYDLVLSTLTRTRDERAATEVLLDFRCEGLILLGPEDRAGWLSALGQELPVVSVGRRLQSSSVDVVRAADDLGVAQAVAHLTGLGHRDIAFVDGGRGAIATDRRRGYRQAMRGHGLAERIRVIPGDHTEAAGYRAAPALLDGHVTAVVASNDRCAVGLLDRLIRLGADVPGSMSVVGYDDSMLARLGHVDLTTVSQDAPRQAEEAVALLADRLDQGRTDPREVVLPPRLIIRSTTAPPQIPAPA
ncbi:MAG TPA: LacI family DNA-binding transcriptional regulator [Streptosporangiaceae bacterium]|nr:LacI family DNA-binding transcriptional regulator [Streptosporangiaceae bacterium]